MGVPVIAQEGAGGGYRLPAEYALTPLPLTANESLLMLVALSALEKLADAPYASERATLRAKLRTLVSARQERELARRLSAVTYDVPARSFSAPHLDRLVQGAQEGRWLQVEYRSTQRTSTQRLMPRRVTTSGGYWYVEAYSLEHGEERRYRADRFMHVELIEAPAAAPAETSDRGYTDPANPEVCIRLTDQAMLRVEREPHLGEQLTPQPDGGALLRFRCPPREYPWLMRYVLGLGAEAEVLEPPCLREQIAALAVAVAAAHR